MLIVKGQGQKIENLKKSEMYFFAEMVLYNKKEIQMMFVECGFNFTEVKNICIFHSWIGK